MSTEHAPGSGLGATHRRADSQLLGLQILWVPGMLTFSPCLKSLPNSLWQRGPSTPYAAIHRRQNRSHDSMHLPLECLAACLPWRQGRKMKHPVKTLHSNPTSFCSILQLFSHVGGKKASSQMSLEPQQTSPGYLHTPPSSWGGVARNPPITPSLWPSPKLGSHPTHMLFAGQWFNIKSWNLALSLLMVKF